MINQEKIEEIKRSINKSCGSCIYLSHESHDYESGCTEPAYCGKRNNVSDLKSFPFKKEQKCFSVDFHLIDSIDEDLFELYKKWWSDDDKKALNDLSDLRIKRYSSLMNE